MSRKGMPSTSKKRRSDYCACGSNGKYRCSHRDDGFAFCNEPLCRRCAKLIKKTAFGPIHYCPGCIEKTKKEQR